MRVSRHPFTKIICKTETPARLFLTHTCPIRRGALGCCASCGLPRRNTGLLALDMDHSTPYPILRRHCPKDLSLGGGLLHAMWRLLYSPRPPGLPTRLFACTYHLMYLRLPHPLPLRFVRLSGAILNPVLSMLPSPVTCSHEISGLGGSSLLDRHRVEVPSLIRRGVGVWLSEVGSRFQDAFGGVSTRTPLCDATRLTALLSFYELG